MNKFLFVLLCTFISFGLMSQRPANITLSDNINNFKIAEPLGAGEAHFIERAKDITYTVYFQNVGIDTALNLRVLDTLSTHLDISSLREEGSSHPFNLTVLNDNVVRFSFPNIRLPNSMVNEEASRGFVSYTVSQKENLPLMTRITNSASIYFDFRPAIGTNTVYHTIFENISDSKQVFKQGLTVSFFPNPVSDAAVLDLQGPPFQMGELQVFDLSGKLLMTLPFQNPRFDFLSSQLSTGQFFYKISLDGQLAASGSFMVK